MKIFNLSFSNAFVNLFLKSNFFQYLLVYLKLVDNWIGFDSKNKVPIPEISWALLRDLLHSDLLLRYRPQELAIGIIYFVCICYGIKIPGSEHKNWFKVFKKKGFLQINSLNNKNLLLFA